MENTLFFASPFAMMQEDVRELTPQEVRTPEPITYKVSIALLPEIGVMFMPPSNRGRSALRRRRQSSLSAPAYRSISPRRMSSMSERA